eukprot:gene16871-16872_t
MLARMLLRVWWAVGAEPTHPVRVGESVCSPPCCVGDGARRRVVRTGTRVRYEESASRRLSAHT